MRWIGTCACVSWLGLTACASAPVEEHHYSLLLDALSDGSVADSSSAPETTDATLAVKAVELPVYLRSNNLVMQVGDNKILPARRHFWAEPLADSLKRVLEYDLQRRLPGIAVRKLPESGCSLEVEFERFHATDDARVAVSGYYSLEFGGERIERTFDTSRTLPVGGYANSISELRKSVGDLAAALASEIEGEISCQPASDIDS
ncbi:MAG: PqiC family protein [Pseudomonadota bacterium]